MAYWRPAERVPVVDEERVPIHDRLAVTRAEAGKLIGGKSEKWVEKHVLPQVRTIKPSRSVLIPRKELDRWIVENADLALGGKR